MREIDIESERSFWLSAIAVFAILAGVNYFPVLLGKIPFPRDMVLQFPAWAGFARSEGWQPYADIGDLVTSFYPFRAIASRSIHEGTLPLWNPYFQAGAPFQADSQSSLFYPLNFFYYVLPLPIAWTVCLVVRMFLAGVFTTLFVRSIGGTRAGAVFSGITFASCGFITAWQGQPLGDAAIWLPLIGYAVHRLHTDHSKVSVSLLAFSFAMPVLAGHPETAAHLTLAGASMALAWCVVSVPHRGRYSSAAFLLSFALAGILALGLASIQVIPTLEWLRQMDEALQFNWPGLPWRQALAWVSRDVIRGPNSAGVWIPEGAAYVGMIGLLAASLAPFHKARRFVALLTAMTVLSAGIAYGIEPLRWLVSHIPVIAGLKNSRMILIASFGMAALGGLGISALENETAFPSRRRLMALFLLGIAVVFTFLLVYRLQAVTQFKVEFTRRPSFSRALLVLSLVPIVWRLHGGLRGRLFPFIACSLAAFDLVTFSYGYMGFAKPDEIFPPAPAFDFLAKQNDPMRFRIAQIGLPYSANANIMYQSSSADGYEVCPTLPRIFALDFTENRWDGIQFIPERVLNSRDRRLDMLNLKYFILNPNAPEFKQFTVAERFRLVFNNGYVAIFENKSVLPRAFAVPASGVEVIQGRKDQLERLRNRSFDPERSVILSAPLRLAGTSGEPVSPLFKSEVELTNGQMNELAFHAQASEPAVLVLSQTYYPGWKATVDGQEVPVFSANLALTGIPLPAGVHNVRFVFQPLSFKVGAALTLVSVMNAVGLVAAGLRAKRRSAQRDAVPAN